MNKVQNNERGSGEEVKGKTLWPRGRGLQKDTQKNLIIILGAGCLCFETITFDFRSLQKM